MKIGEAIAGWDPQLFQNWRSQSRAEQCSEEIQRAKGEQKHKNWSSTDKPAGIPQQSKLKIPEQGSEEIPETKEVQKHKTNEAEVPDDTSTQKEKKSKDF